MKAVRFVSPDGETRIGALLDGHVRDAGPAGRQGFVPTPDAWRALGEAAGTEYAVLRRQASSPRCPGQDPRHRRQLPLACRRIRAGCPIRSGRLRQMAVVPHRARGRDRRPRRRGSAGLRGRSGLRARRDGLSRGRGRRPGARSAASRRSTTSPGDARSSRRRCDSSRSARASTRSRRLARASPRPTAVDVGDIHLTTTVSGEVMQDASTSDLVFGFVDLSSTCRKVSRFERGT